jgi:ADP-ribosylglycohydrolase
MASEDPDVRKADAAELRIVNLGHSEDLATEAHLIAYASSVGELLSTDLRRHEHFRGQMFVTHKIALCAEYLQEKYGKRVSNSRDDCRRLTRTRSWRWLS